jgi:hypothetical protein
MTYKDLLLALNQLNEEQLNHTVTIFDPYTDEFTAVVHTGFSDEKDNDVLDPDHFYLVLKA